MPLNDTQIRNYKPNEKLYKRADGLGLYIQVNPNGSKHWYRKYSFQGKETRASYGRYPQVSLADARKMRDADIALLAKGINPNTERQSKKRSPKYR
ncbi:Arm DNA-binding domain-containing protein [Limnobaculum xujianqingii]|uniref:Arm DNA-binding domain-containing protein n=1 Tax=Limnobaculum xujianqingii TaxID=2738837 RepID=UPI00112D742F|nr:Arm DNA-binding domain-containing protein [Limnobaculum xujianqingii]